MSQKAWGVHSEKVKGLWEAVWEEEAWVGPDSNA